MAFAALLVTMAPMTTLLARSTRSAQRATQGSARAVSVAGTVAAARAAALGLLAVTVAVLVGWATAADTGASAREAVTASLNTWLLAHHTTLTIPGGTFGLTPVGLTAAFGWLLSIEGQRAARACDMDGNRGVVAVTCVLSSSYALTAAVVALLARTDVVRPMPVTAFLGAAVVAAAFGGAGAMRGAQTWAATWRRVPMRVRFTLSAAAGATAVLLGGGALVVALALTSHVDRVVDLVRALEAGLPGLVLIGLLSLAYVPTAVVWGASFVLGPGFAVGAGTTVGLTGVQLGAIPGFPLLAALPADDVPRAIAVGLVLVPLGAGVVAGLLLDRADRRRTVSVLSSWRQVVTMASATGAVSGAALTACTVVAGGPGGPGRLAHVGPSWWQVALATTLAVGLVSGVTVVVRRHRTWRVRRPAALGRLLPRGRAHS